MDSIAIAHTGVHRGLKKADLRVEYMHLGLLLGYVENILITAVMNAKEEGWDSATKRDVVGAWNKVLWVQNDLFARRYVVDRDTKEGLGLGMDTMWKDLGLGVLGILMGMVLMGVLTIAAKRVL